MRGCLSRFIHQLLTFGADGDEERVQRHGGIDGDLATELIFDFASLDGIWTVLVDDLEEVCMWSEVSSMTDFS